MDNYGEAYKRELERAKLEMQIAKRTMKPIFDVAKTIDRFEQVLEDLQKVGAPIITKPLTQLAPATYGLTMVIGETDYEVIFFNDSIKVFWRGRDKTPMIYDAQSASRMNALARVIIDKAVASTLENEQKAQRTVVSKVVRFPQS